MKDVTLTKDDVSSAPLKTKEEKDTTRMITKESYKEIKTEVTVKVLHGETVQLFEGDNAFKYVTNYVDGKKEGLETEYKGQNVLRKINYKNNEVVSDIEFYDDGNIKREKIHTNPNTYSWKWYSPNGKIKSESHYKNKVEVLEKLYWEDSEKIRLQRFRDDEGNPTGDWYQYNEDGKVVMERHYRNGIPDGKWLGYTRGTKSVSHYSDGKKNGLFTGQVGERGKFIKNYKNDKLHGFYSKQSGIRKEEGNYNNGKKEGVWKGFFDDKLRSETTWKNGKLEGSRKLDKVS
jgi:antitoxin component YwqK of YwqJK toxin-antitoxin module